MVDLNWKSERHTYGAKMDMDFKEKNNLLKLLLKLYVHNGVKS